MALLNFINMGGPINWVLFAILCFCICQCIERSIYFIITSKNHKKSCMTRIKNKSQQIKNLDKKSKQRELEKESTLLYYEMNRGLWFLNFISAVSPSIGLLGTVVGLINSFQGMSKAGAQVNIQDLSSGIWVAMLTTAFGMMISIPALFFYRSFRRIIEKRTMAIGLFIEDELDSASSF